MPANFVNKPATSASTELAHFATNVATDFDMRIFHGTKLPAYFDMRIFHGTKLPTYFLNLPLTDATKFEYWA